MCDNGTEFKNSVMNQFCEDKGIKREFSVARTPQQNRVAERRNRTLIEAAKTMALVIKPHKKSPYELIHGRPPLIDFMKPFGYPVTILNTRDNLGKFKGKADEGYFAVVAGNQTNGIAGSKEKLVAGQDDKQKELEKKYILIPIYTNDPLISQGTKDSAVDAGKKAPEVDESEASDNVGKNDQVPRSEAESLFQQERQTKNINITNSVNTVNSPVNTIRSSFVNAASQTPINAARSSANAFEEHSFEQFSPFKNAFSLPHVPIVTPIDDTRIFGNAYDDEVLEGEVDMNNVDSSYIIPEATNFLKNHPQEQVIGSLETPVQTRQMSKTHEEFGLLSSVHKLRRTNHKDF
nr:hypothetical protein [Tanacetum cinerariifolium]